MIMKKICLLLFLMVLSSNSFADNIPDLEHKMMNFFCQTLKQNYGKADGEAVLAIVEGLRYYKNNYIIDVNKKKLKKINDELFASALTGYFFDRDSSNVKTIIWNKENYDPYQPFICERYLMKPDGETYYQKELQASAHPFLKKVCRDYEFAGNEGIPIYLGYIMTDHRGCMADFEKDEDIRMFMTLIFWRYLCYCANIDFRTGDDKTDFIMKKMDGEI